LNNDYFTDNFAYILYETKTAMSREVHRFGSLSLFWQENSLRTSDNQRGCISGNL